MPLWSRGHSCAKANWRWLTTDNYDQCATDSCQISVPGSEYQELKRRTKPGPGPYALDFAVVVRRTPYEEPRVGQGAAEHLLGRHCWSGARQTDGRRFVGVVGAENETFPLPSPATATTLVGEPGTVAKLLL